MDERDFEARLSARLHERFGHLEPSPQLRLRVADTRGGGWQPVRVRSNWTLAAVVALVATVTLLVVLRPASTPTVGATPSPSASMSPSPTRSSPADPESSRIPGVVPAPHWPIAGVDAGNAPVPSPGPGGKIDEAWAWGSLSWSPDGSTLLAAAESQEQGEGQIHLFDRTGHPVGAVPGWAAVWIDDNNLMTLETNADGATRSAWRWSKDARSSELVSRNADSFLASSRGAVAIGITDAAGANTFQVWTAHGLSAKLPGYPISWSPDGSRLAVLRDLGTSLESNAPRVIFAAGSSLPEMWLQILDGSDLREVSAYRNVRLDTRADVLFDPSGASIASGSTVLDLATGVEYRLPTDHEAVAWSPDGRLVVADDIGQTLAEWTPSTHLLGPSLKPGTRLDVFQHLTITAPTQVLADWPHELLGPGVVSPDGALRGWAGGGTGSGDTPLWLVPASSH